MSENAPVPIEVTLPNKKKLKFSTAQDYKQWAERLQQDWSWLAGSPAKRALERITEVFHNTRNQVSDWGRYSARPEIVSQTQAVIGSAISRICDITKGLLWDDASLAAIQIMREKHGAPTAAGFFTALVEGEIHIEHTAPEAFFSGLIRGFLFKNEIDWTATAHGEALRKIETQIRECLSQQNDRLNALEVENSRLNTSHQQTLEAKDQNLENLKKEKTRALDELYQQKDNAFNELSKSHLENFKKIEDSFHNKLALSKPVDYWEKRHTKHSSLSKRFACAVSITLLLLGSGLAWVIHWAFGSRGDGSAPQSWQVGVTVVSAFFVIWIVRLLVRLFLSHQHLATDASERVTMVQTFLALSKEETGIAKEDRSIILQQLFKSASDVLVKDDGAPPGWLEWLSRQK